VIMKVVTVVGARPQLIKASVVSSALREAGVEEVLVHTGQHYDANMSDIFFSELGMDPPAYALGIGGGSHGAMTGRMLEKIEQVLVEAKPDLVLVYGDTNSTLAGALAAVKMHVPVAHVEAGLRSFNMRMPEEVNRILTDRVSTWLFAPTSEAVSHLKRESIADERIFEVGDVMFDVAVKHGERARTLSSGLLDRLGVSEKAFVLVTIHRAENTDEPQRLWAIVDGLIAASASQKIVWPLHPRTRAALAKMQVLDRLAAHVVLVDPLGYLDIVRLEQAASVIATDSGGVQKEAFFHGTPCVTLRDETEWVELVAAGWNRLQPPTDASLVCSAILESIGKSGRAIAPYGSGQASRQIVGTLVGSKG